MALNANDTDELLLQFAVKLFGPVSDHELSKLLWHFYVERWWCRNRDREHRTDWKETGEKKANIRKIEFAQFGF